MGTRKMLVGTLGLLLSVSLPGANGFSAGRALPVERSNENSIILEYEFGDPTVTTRGQYDEVSLPGLARYPVVGAPIVPVKPVEVLIPLGKKPVRVESTALEAVTLAGTYSLPPGAQTFPRNMDPPPGPTPPDPKYYGMTTAWPGTYHRELPVQSKRGFELLNVNLFPIQYVPSTGQITLVTKLRLEIQLADDEKGRVVKPTKNLKDTLKRKIHNPSAIDSYSREKVNQANAKARKKTKGRAVASRLPIPLGRTKKSARPEVKKLVGTLRGAGAEKTPRLVNTPDGYVRSLGAPAGRYFEVDKVRGKKPETLADDFLEQNRNLFVNESSSVEFERTRAMKRKNRNYLHYEQTYAGLPVLGAEIIIQVNDDAGVAFVTSGIMTDTQVLDSGEVSLVPRITEQGARDAAIEWMGLEHPGLRFEASPGALMIYAPPVVDEEGTPQLVWRTEVGSGANAPGTPVREYVFVNAHTGEIVFDYSLIHNANYRKISLEASENVVRVEGDEEPYGQDEVDSTYDYLGDAYDFFWNHHGRDGYDDNGYSSVKPLSAVVRMGIDNAYTYDNTIYIGRGNATDDIVGHEFTHAVIGSVWGPVGPGQTAAIAESLSDIWGEWIDQTNGKGNDDPSVKWRLFEDWECSDWPEPCRVWRVMDDPPSVCTDSFYGTPWDESFAGSDNCEANPPAGNDFGDLQQPDRYSRLYDGTQDGRGAHHNLGVGNKLAYLLTDGDTFNGYSIYGMGIDTASALFYEAIHLLVERAKYHDLGFALTRAALNLADELGLTDEDLENVRNACRAVEILDTEEVQYVIVTSDQLATEAHNLDPNYSFQALCQSKIDRGISCEIVTTNWISDNYDGITPWQPEDPAPLNEDRQTEIRNFLIDAYQTWGTEYALLAGDKDVIPDRKFRDSSTGSPAPIGEIPADLYYSNVDPPECTFDNNANGDYGEVPVEGVIEEGDGVDLGEVDLYADIYVGRAPISEGHPEEVVNFVRKTLTYETTEDAYLNRAGLVGGYLGFEGLAGFARTFAEFIRDGSNLYLDHYTFGFNDPDPLEGPDRPVQNLREFQIAELYDADWVQHDETWWCPEGVEFKCGWCAEDPGEDVDWSYCPEWDWQEHGWSADDPGDPNDLLDMLNEDTPHILYTSDHGQPYRGMVRVYTTSAFRIDGPPWSHPREEPNVPGLATHLGELQNTNYFFLYDDSCNLGAFDLDDSFAEVIITSPNGAFGSILNSRVGWAISGDGPLDSPTTRMIREFFHKVLGEGVFELGRAHALAKEANLTGLEDIRGTRFIYYGLNLFGDPELSLRVTEGDSDGDGIPDDVEGSSCTDPNDADTDDDGILDGDEDLDRNGVVGAGETDPCDADTDDDGIQDGTEMGYTTGHPADTDPSVFQPDLYPLTTTDPLAWDTDGDGMSDGDEDVNGNGKVDRGEQDPTSYDCDFLLHNKTIQPGTVLNYISSCSITAGPNYFIEPNAAISFTASDTVILLPGFEAREGSEFEAGIQ